VASAYVADFSLVWNFIIIFAFVVGFSLVW
jgi:hypothetical protein